MTIYVIKIGGEIISHKNCLQNLLQAITTLPSNIRVVFVHGGGQQATELDKKLGNEPQIINGRRITDAHTLETLKMVFAGKINIEILSMLQAMGIDAVGLSGVDANMISVNRRGIQTVINKDTGNEQPIDFGFVGDIVAIQPQLLITLLENKFIPVIAPLAADPAGVIYNVNADTVASSLALSLQAEKLIMISNVNGIYDVNGKLFQHLNCQQARSLIQDGTITGGMIPKVESLMAAMQSGMRSAHIINGFYGSNLAKILVNEPVGTSISTAGSSDDD
jgi:acetylglutamate kinase